MAENNTTDIQAARALYDEYIATGFAMHPPFKGFAMEHLWFAIDEPEAYHKLFIEDKHFSGIDEWIEYEGHKEQVLDAIMSTFGMSEEEALDLYRTCWPVMIGLVSARINGMIQISIESMSMILGKAVRGALLMSKAGADKRAGYVPNQSEGPQGNVQEYVDKGVHEIGQRNNELMLQAMISQNRLLGALHSSPRYVKDNEWVELDRLAQGGFGINRRIIEERFEAVTSSDARLIILEKLGFGVGASALLLGISPTSVTKARQRLKAKLSISSVDEFVNDL